MVNTYLVRKILDLNSFKTQVMAISNIGTTTSCYEFFGIPPIYALKGAELFNDLVVGDDIEVIPKSKFISTFYSPRLNKCVEVRSYNHGIHRGDQLFIR